jgi:uncharacterized membrane protein HdeD (DUF308 family)
MIRLETDPETQKVLRKGTTWGVVLGVLIALLGVLAIALPLVATLAVTLLFGWLFIGVGVFQIVYAIQTRQGGQFPWKLIWGLLYLAAGVLILFNPVQGVLTLTLILGVTIFVQSAIQIVMAFQLRPAAHWGWLLFSGILGIILGILIWSNWPYSAVWVLGLWVGINLLVDGITIVVASLTLRSALNQDAQIPQQ